MTTTTRMRTVESLVQGRQTSDGAGVKLTRVLTQDLQRRLDPFLMLDAFRNDNPDDYIGGFPNHPHRGFETVTYMLAGRMRHHDSAGNEGLLEPGGAQWMTAGSGLIHSELPEQEDGLMEGFQLWVNLPAAQKMIAPSYQDIPSSAIPEVTTASGVKVRIIAGECEGKNGDVTRPDTRPVFWDVHMPAGSVFEHALNPGFNAFLYTYRGGVSVGDVDVADRQMAIFKNDGADAVRVSADKDSKFILIAGQPLNEPIVQYGPFVMNTSEQIQQTLQDFRQGLFESVVVKSL